MKHLLALLLTLLSFSAQGQLSGGGGGSRPKPILITGNRCFEGDRQPFTGFEGNGRQFTVWRTCQAGRFFPKANVKPILCKPCTLSAFSTIDVSGRYHDEWRICVNGRFVDPDGPENLCR